MKASKLIVGAMVLFSPLVFAKSDPEELFDTAPNKYVTVSLSWHPVDDIQTVCRNEYKKRNLGNLVTPVQACAFWNNNVCTIYTRKVTTMNALGHETRHCFQFHFH